jgi:hypothetical protein
MRSGQKNLRAAAVLLGLLNVIALQSEAQAQAYQLQTAPNGDITVQTESNGHKFKFVVPSSGPLSISELAPIGSAPILNDELVATKTPGELYLSVAGPGATVPDALVNAQNRSNAPATRQSATGSGPIFYDSDHRGHLQ